MRTLQQYLPFTVCVEGCETAEEQSDDEVRTSQVPEQSEGKTKMMKQQYLPFTVCAERCETAEEQRDDEVRTSQVSEQSECKTKVIKQQCLPFTVLKLRNLHALIIKCSRCNGTYCLRYWNLKCNGLILWLICVATVPTACGIETDQRNSSSWSLAVPKLQQHLPLAVLKRAPLTVLYLKILALQQYLPFTVLKLM